MTDPPTPPEEIAPLEELRALVAGLAAHLARGTDLGVRRVPRPPPAKAEPGAPRARAAPVEAGRELSMSGEHRFPTGVDPAAVAVNRAAALACTGLQELRAAVAACTACRLAKTRTQTVFSDGPPRARVLFIGEAPGQHEDEQGVPFVGAAGQLLTDIIQKGMRLPRGEVYIANVLKCRPPGNRDPEPDETALCTPFLDRQIELVAPEILITLGLHATRHVLGSPLPMARLRGRIHPWKGRKVVATYHPAYLLRNPEMKKACWEDIQLAMRELGLGSAAGPGTRTQGPMENGSDPTIRPP